MSHLSHTHTLNTASTCTTTRPWLSNTRTLRMKIGLIWLPIFGVCMCVSVCVCLYPYVYSCVCMCLCVYVYVCLHLGWVNSFSALSKVFRRFWHLCTDTCSRRASSITAWQSFTLTLWQLSTSDRRRKSVCEELHRPGEDNTYTNRCTQEPNRTSYCTVYRCILQVLHRKASRGGVVCVCVYIVSWGHVTFSWYAQHRLTSLSKRPCLL